MNLLYALDLIGTLVFAISGLRLAAKKDMDIFGATVIACVTAVGGGTVRDLLLGATPVAWIVNIHYPIAIISAVPITIVFKKYIINMKRTIFIFDSVGIALFTISGMEKALEYGLNPGLAMAMGMVSAVVGGVIRDLLCNEIPLIFRKEIYATACLTGALFFFILSELGVNTDLNYILTISVIFTIRVVAIKFNLSMPKMR
ncbi:MAG: trimeric intracellular cation channel family protein [Fulvivirga sp.]|uniref:trimeric intracellular cation channel family protein n=1 Tax=Fulvivirga sp. TaxID=1931237 RepID=UPI0032EFFA67